MKYKGTVRSTATLLEMLAFNATSMADVGGRPLGSFSLLQQMYVEDRVRK